MSKAHCLIACAGSAMVVAAGLFTTPASAATLKVACTGTSAMQGLGSTTGHHVPDELGKALGSGFEVKNFAVEGTTAIKSVSTSYAATPQMKAALAYNPDVVLFWFGGNDSFKGTWDAHKGEFKADYTSLVKAFQDLPSHPKTLLVRLWVFVDGPVQRTVVDKEILPIINQIGAETGSFLIDYRKAFEMHSDYFPDGMHPNDTGTLAIGKLFADSVTMALAGEMGADGGLVPDAASSGFGRDADTGGLGVEDAAPIPHEAEAPASMGAGGSSGGAGGASGVTSTGTSGSAAPPSAGTGTMVDPSPAVANDSGGCRMGRGGAAGSDGGSSALWIALALGLSRRRARELRG